MSIAKLLRRSHINDLVSAKRALRVLARQNIPKMNDPYISLQDIRPNKAGHVDRVFRSAVRRSVPKLKMLKIFNGQSRLDGRSEHVDSLVHSILAHSLSAGQLS